MVTQTLTAWRLVFPLSWISFAGFWGSVASPMLGAVRASQRRPDARVAATSRHGTAARHSRSVDLSWVAYPAGIACLYLLYSVLEARLAVHGLLDEP